MKLLIAVAATLALAAAGVYVVATAANRRDQLMLARQAAARRDTLAALDAYEKHLERSPVDHAARVELAELLKPLDADRALQHLRQIPPDSPSYPEAMLNIAHIATAGGMDRLAESSLKQLDRLRPDDPAVALALTEFYFRADRNADAKHWSQQAISRQPNRARSWLLLAEILDRLRRTSEMRLPLEKAVALEPELYEAHANLVYVLHFLGELDQAQREADWCLRRRPDDLQVRRWFAQILREQGRHGEALEQIRIVLKSAPNDVDARLVEANVLLYRRQSEAAYEALRPFYEPHKNRRDYLEALARAAALSGRREEAAKYQDQVRRIIDRAEVADGVAVPDVP